VKAATRTETPQNSNELHGGITMHKLQIGSGFPALLFAVGSAAIFLIALPSLWYFLALAVLLGIGVAVMLRFLHS
jgi:hypothetical protein